MAGRKGQKEALRAGRKAKAADAATAERRKRLVGYGAAGFVAAVAVGAAAVLVLAGGADSGDSQEGESRAAEPSSGDFVKASIPAKRIATLDEAAAAAKCKVAQFTDDQGPEQVP